MIAFEIHLNGEKLCVAGIGEHGVLSQTLSWVGRKPKADEEKVKTREPHFRVGGLVNDEHVNWIRQTSVSVGDEVVIVIVDVASVDEPILRKRAETGEERAQKVSDGLAATKALLPSPLIEGEWLASLRGYSELLAAGEPEMGVKTLAKLGDLNACAPAFWEALSMVASDLKMYRQRDDYAEKADLEDE